MSAGSPGFVQCKEFCRYTCSGRSLHPVKNGGGAKDVCKIAVTIEALFLAQSAQTVCNPIESITK